MAIEGTISDTRTETSGAMAAGTSSARSTAMWLMPTRTDTSWVLRLGAQSAYTTAVVAPIGLVFLFAMYAAFAMGAMSQGLVFGWINDVLAIVTGLVMLPVVVAVHVLLRSAAPRPSQLLLLIGIGANGAIVILQSLLVVGALTFVEEIGPVLVAFLFLAVWFVMTGYVGSRSGALPRGVRMGVLAVTYVCYPIWAFWLGRQLVRLAREPRIRASSSLPAHQGEIAS